MQIDFSCPECGNECHVDDQFAGRKARCVRCNAPLVVPSPTSRFIDFSCPECGNACHVDERFAGRAARCLQCNAPLVVPEATVLKQASSQVTAPSKSQNTWKSRPATSPAPPKQSRRNTDADWVMPPPLPVPATAAPTPVVPPPLPPGSYARSRRGLLLGTLTVLVVGGIVSGGIYLYGAIKKTPPVRRANPEPNQEIRPVVGPRFDGASFERTKDWADALSAALVQEQAKGNKIAFEQIVKTAEGRLQSLVEQSVQWQIPIAEKTRTHIWIQQCWPRNFVNSDTNFMVTLVDRKRPSPNFPDIDNWIPFGVVAIGTEVSETQALRLKRGDLLPVTAKVRKVSLINGKFVYVELKSYRSTASASANGTQLGAEKESQVVSYDDFGKGRPSLTGQAGQEPKSAREPSSLSGISQAEAQRIVTEYLERGVSERTKIAHYKWSKAVAIKADKYVLEADISPGDVLTVVYHEYRQYDQLPGGGIGTVGGVIGRKFHIKDGQVVMITR